MKCKDIVSLSKKDLLSDETVARIYGDYNSIRENILMGYVNQGDFDKSVVHGEKDE